MFSDYLTLSELLDLVEEPNQSRCRHLLNGNKALLIQAPGSGHNHQAWPGGWLDHTVDGMNVMLKMYQCFNALRPLPFSLSSALLVFLLHDLEKPWKYCGDRALEPVLSNKGGRAEFRLQKIRDYGIELSDEESNALRYVEGEGDDYSGEGRAMNELAAFCHMADVASARLWHDYPKPQGLDEWPGAHCSIVS